MMKDKPKIKEMNHYLNQTDNVHLSKLRQSKFKIIKFIVRLWHQMLIGKLAGGNLSLSYQRRSNLDKKWLIMVLKDYRRSLLLAEGQCKKIPLSSDGWLYPIDIEIAKTIFELNRQGVKTSFSCQGHLKPYGYSSPYISLDYNQKFPSDLIQDLKVSNIKYQHNLQKEKKDNPYRHGESLYGYVRNEITALEDYTNFLKVLENWANKKNNTAIKDLKNQWKS